MEIATYGEVWMWKVQFHWASPAIRASIKRELVTDLYKISPRLLRIRKLIYRNKLIAAVDQHGEFEPIIVN